MFRLGTVSCKVSIELFVYKARFWSCVVFKNELSPLDCAT